MAAHPKDRISGNFLDIPPGIRHKGQVALAMDTALLLTEREVVDITGYQKPKRQIRALEQMGIYAKQNARGRVVVSRRHAEQMLAGEIESSVMALTPDFSWMEG